MRIYDGRDAFSQWDKDVMLTSTDFKIGDEVHITNCRLPNAMTVVVYEYNGKAVIDVPNILLQTTYPIVAFRYVNDGKSGYTIEKYEFKINQKPKPDDYVYTETEILTWEALDKRVEALERGGGTGGTVDPEYIEELVDEYLAENPPPPGEKGEKGDPGEPGKDGVPGADGYTPKKGVDYWTESDKAEIKYLVDESTGENYELFVSNGKLMMRKVEV